LDDILKVRKQPLFTNLDHELANKLFKYRRNLFFGELKVEEEGGCLPFNDKVGNPYPYYPEPPATYVSQV
jgi:hypothetical protein